MKEAEPLRALAERRLAHYEAVAESFWLGTRDA